MKDPVRCFEHALARATIVTLPVMGDNYAYLIISGGQAAVVDPADAAPVQAALKARGLKAGMVLNTHHHFDHVSGNLELKAGAGCEVAGPDDPRIPGLDRPLGEGARVMVGDLALKVLATPGHTRSSICFYAEDGPCLWSGDTLFSAGCGRLIECAPEVMWNSLCRLADLPDDTLLFCGHEYTEEDLQFAAGVDPENDLIQQRLTEVRESLRQGLPTVPVSLGVEKSINPFLRVAAAAIRRALNLPHAPDVAVFAELRRRKDLFN